MRPYPPEEQVAETPKPARQASPFRRNPNPTHETIRYSLKLGDPRNADKSFGHKVLCDGGVSREGVCPCA